jgi:hypothetical protein
MRSYVGFVDRNSADERLEWQGHIPALIENLRSHMKDPMQLF